MSEASALLSEQLNLAGIPHVTEHRFHPTRKWRFDVALPEQRLAIEVQGGGFVGGRHTTGMGLEKDAEKMSEAVAAHWYVMLVTPRQVKDGRALDWIRRAARLLDSDIQRDPYPDSLIQ